MADNTNPAASSARAAATDTALILENTFRSLSENIKGMVQEQLAGTDTVVKSYANEIQKSINSFTKDADKLVENTKKLERGLLTVKDITKQNLDLEAKRDSLQRRITNLSRENSEVAGVLNKELEVAKKLTKELLDENTQLAEKAKEIEKRTGALGKTLTGISKIPILRGFVDADEALIAMRKSAEKNESQFKVMTTGLKAGFGNLFTNPIAQLEFGYGLIKKVLGVAFEATTRVAELGRTFGVSMSTAKTMAEGYYKASENFLATYEEVAELSNTVNARFGTAVPLLSKAAGEAVELKNTLGLTNEETATLLERGTNLAGIINKQTNQYNKQNKVVISSAKISKEILGVEGQLRNQLVTNTQEFIKQNLTASKLGTSLKEARDISHSYLDFESSIQSQMEAELLTGKTMNLDRARGLALQGKYAEAVESALGKNMTSLKFGKLNVIQQEGYAKALGMTTDQLSDILYKKEHINKQGQTAIDQLKKEGRITEANALEKALATGQNLKDAQEATKQSMLQEKATKGIKDALLNAATSLQPVVTSISKVIVAVTEFLKRNSWLGKILLGGGLGLGAISMIAGVAGTVKDTFGKVKEVFGKGDKSKPTGTKSNPLHVTMDGGSGGGGAGGGGEEGGGLSDILDSLTEGEGGGGGGRKPGVGKSFTSRLTKGASKLFGGKKTAIGRGLRNLSAKSIKTARAAAGSGGVASKLMNTLGKTGVGKFASKIGGSAIGKIASKVGGSVAGSALGQGVGKLVGGSGVGSVIGAVKDQFDFFKDSKTRGTGFGGWLESLGGSGLSLLDWLPKVAGMVVGKDWDTGGFGLGIKGMDTDNVANARAIYRKLHPDAPTVIPNKVLISDIRTKPQGYTEDIIEDQQDVDIEKLATGGLVTRGGLAKVDSGEVYLGANSLTVLKSMLESLQKQNQYLAALVAKDTTLNVDGQKLASVVAKNVPTTYGNLLNPASRAYS